MVLGLAHDPPGRVDDAEARVCRARRGCGRDIEKCGEPGRAQMDIGPIGPDINAVDQGGQDGTLSCSGQLGPALADFPGARDEPALS